MTDAPAAAPLPPDPSTLIPSLDDLEDGDRTDAGVLGVNTWGGCPHNFNDRSPDIGQLVAAMCEVIGKLGPIEKSEAPGLKYKFLAESVIVASLRKPMADAGLVVFPLDVRRVEREDYKTSGGAEMTRYLIRARYRIAHKSGQYQTVEAFGEASDSGDKCMNKAMTAAYKYALRQSFLISHGDDPDEQPPEKTARGARHRPGVPLSGPAAHAPRPASGQSSGNPGNGKPADKPSAKEERPLEERHAKCLAKIDRAETVEKLKEFGDFAATLGFNADQTAAVLGHLYARYSVLFAGRLEECGDLEAVEAVRAEYTRVIPRNTPDLVKIHDKLGALADGIGQRLVNEQEAMSATMTDDPADMLF